MGLLVYDLMAFSIGMWHGGGDWWFVEIGRASCRERVLVAV